MIKIMKDLWVKLWQGLHPKEDPILEPTEVKLETLEKDFRAAKAQIETMQKKMQEIENQRIAIQKEKERVEKECQALQEIVDTQKVYFTALDDRYGDFLKIARKTNESDPRQIQKLWHLVVAMSFHHYDYMKMVCNDVNWRAVQDTNIQLIHNQQVVTDLPLDAYVPYSADPREIELHFRVLRRLLKQVGIEKLDDVLLSGVRISKEE
jgi:hypothetical protein